MIYPVSAPRTENEPCNSLPALRVQIPQVTNAMWKSTKAPFRLLLNSKASDEIKWNIEHYKRVEVMKGCETGCAVAAQMGVTEQVLWPHSSNF